MHVAQQNLYNASARVTLADELAHSREAHRDQRELGRGKKTIKRDERQDPDYANGEHAWCMLPLRSL
jgi:hypothetical protein